MQPKKAMFGISVFKQSITNDVIGAIAQFLARGYDDNLIILVDEPEVHNWLLRGRRSPGHAKEVVDRVAGQRISAIKRVLRRHNLDVPVHTWGLISSDLRYLQNVAATTDFYARDPEFRADVQNQIHAYLGPYVEEAAERLGRPLTGVELDEAALFLLEELAGLAHLHYDLGYSTDVYPDPQSPVPGALLTGAKYAELGRALRIRPEIMEYIVHP